MKKRSLPATTGSSVADEVGGSNKRNNRSSSPSPCEYAGYSFQRDQEVAIGVETIDASSIDPPIFFDKFISKRKPCILQSNNKTLTTTNNAAKDWNRMFHLSPQDLVDAAGQEFVQVEKRFSADESFGQNRTKSRQIQMTVNQLVDKLKSNSPEGELLYLSTQQQQQQQPPEDGTEDDHDDDDDDEKPPASPAAFQTPCAQLLHSKKIEPTLPCASTLLLEACNLWMGSSMGGSSSGLHHDYHDNFYLLLQGTKQFRLYSPDTAHSMSTYGTIELIHFNGVISYVGSETNPDGSPVERRMARNGDGDGDDDARTGLGDDGSKAKGVRNEDHDEDDEAADESEEEVVLGKGFDYQSDEDEEDMVDMDGPDDFDELVDRSALNPNKDSDEEDSPSDKSRDGDADQERPNSFSRIDPADFDPKQHLDFQNCNEHVVELKAGQILYLPAGWFHNVTSFNSSGETKDDATSQQNVHMALNYWYHPPDRLDSFTSPYTKRRR